MSYLKSLEREYAMGDTQLFNEFDTSHFISNAKSAITNKVEAVNMNMKFDYYTSMLKKAIQSFSTIKLDKELIRDFLMKFDSLAKLDNTNTMVRDIEYTDVISFKPQYLAQYVTMVQVAIDRAIRGEISQEEIVRYISGEIPEKVERQVVKTTLTYGLQSKDLVKIDSTKYVKADTAYVKGKVIPFVTKYEQIKNEAITEANSVMNAINETEETVKAIITTIEKIKASGNVDGTKIQLLNQISYNAIRGIIEVISYVSFMLIRKLNTVSSNIIACNDLYIDISNMYADSTMESAFDNTIFNTDIKSLAEGLMNGKTTAYGSLAKNIYDFHAILPDASNIDDPVKDNQVNMEVDQHNYDKTAYENIIKSYLEISVGLDIIAVEADEYLLIYDDIIKKSGFSLILEERFQNELRDIQTVSDNSLDLVRLLAEVKDFENNMTAIANVIYETYNKLKHLQNRYASNTNGEYSDFETINELKIFLGGLEEQYKAMTEKVASACYDRIKDLGVKINNAKNNSNIKIDVNTIQIETSSNLDFSEAFIDYNDIMFDSIMESYEEEHKNYFNALQRSYFAEKELVLRGVTAIFEADEPNANTATQNNTQQNTTNTSTNTNSTKVTVQDNSEQAKGVLGKLTSKVSEFIRNTVDRFLEFIEKSAKKNLKWLQDNKDELINRSYNNVTVNILPYQNIPSKQITDDILKVQNNVKMITSQSLQSITNKDALYSKLFPFISNLKEANGPLADQIKKYYKVGNGELQVKPISNGELKTEITTVMIPFCEEYLGGYKNTLDQNLSSLGKALDDTIASYNTTATTESVSIFIEAEETTGNNIKDKVDWMKESVKYFSGSVLNAVRDRNVDYLKVLSSLVPKTPAKPVTSNNDQANQTNQTEQPAQQQ